MLNQSENRYFLLHVPAQNVMWERRQGSAQTLLSLPVKDARALLLVQHGMASAKQPPRSC